ncbi:hypothetical protein RRG08_023624 [Elysia crispata]|uniref:Cytochrome P450 n=1 Tax=Elysia crispata TaxID=231223 RepID=A0AAE0XSQ9_9GAST|nr:hypothetical protein RRG08_023624 [Elysia crispata]
MKKFRFFRSLPQDKNFSILLGNIQNIPKDPEDRIAYGRSKMDNLHPKLNCMWMGPFDPVIVVYHPDTIKSILKSSAPKSRGFARIYEMLLPWIGEGLIVSNGAVWQRSRRLLTPAFHFDILKPYIEIDNKAADKLLKKLEPFAKSGESLDIYPMLTLCTLEVILKCALSYDVDIQAKSHDPYAQSTRQLTEIFTRRTRTPWYWPTFIFKRTEVGKNFFQCCDFVHSMADEIIQKRKSELEKEEYKSKKRLLDFIDILLMARDEDGKAMTTQEIRSEVDTFMFAGHDTTSSGTMWFLYCLAKNPEYQFKIQEEVDAVLEGRDSDHIQWSDLSELPILALCLKEAMRLYPPVPFIQRELTEETIIDGHMIPKGTLVTVSIVHLHVNPTVWEDRDEFRPERFTWEEMKGRDSFSYVPFSAGPRNCIGQHFAVHEIKVLTSRILRKFTLELAPNRPPPVRFAQATLQSQNGMWLKFKLRTEFQN